MSSEKKIRRPAGEGGIDPLPSGKWRVRVRLPNGQRVTRTCATEEEANELRRGLVYELNQAPELVQSTTPCAEWTLKKWGELWLDRREIQRATRYSDAERAMWKRYVLASSLADMQLATIRTRDVRAFVSTLLSRRSKGRALRSPTVKKALNLLRKSLSDAAQDELISSNPATSVPIPRRSNDSTETTFLTAAEVEAVVTCEAIPERERLIYTVAIYTGLRAGELWALRWADVELEGERPQITVRRSHRFAPKNGKVQTVPLLAPARAALLRTRELLGECEDDDLVFPTERGHQRLRGDDARWCTRRRKSGRIEPGYREIAGIKRRVRFHDLRHTCASHLVMGTWGAPWPLSDVAKMLRHSSITVTERYAHLAPGYLHEQAQRTARGADSPPSVTQARGSQLAPPARIERATNALGKRTPIAANSSPNALRDPPVTHALALLRAVDEGRPSAEHLESLVGAVLGEPLVALALRVREGGPLRIRLAVELAGMVLDGSTQDVLRKGEG